MEKFTAFLKKQSLSLHTFEWFILWKLIKEIIGLHLQLIDCYIARYYLKK